MNSLLNYLCITFAFFLLTIHASEKKLCELTAWKYSIAENPSDSTTFILDDTETIDWVSIQNPSEIMAQKGKVVLLKTKLPQMREVNSVLYIGQITYPIKVYFENKLIFEFGNFDLNTNKYIRWNQILIDLLPSNKSNELIIVAKIGNEFNGFFEKILIGQPSAIFSSLIKSDLFLLLFTAFSFFTGMLTLLFYFFAERNRLMIIFAMFLFSIVILLAVNLSMLQVLFPHPILYLHFNYIGLGLASIFILIIVEEVVLQKYKLLINIIWKIRTFILILTILLLSFTDLVYFSVVKYITLFTILSFIISLASLFLSASKRSYESKLIFWGILGIVFSALIEIIIFYFKGVINTTFGYKIIAIPFGVMIFVGSIIWLVIYNALETKRKKEESQQLAFNLMEKENRARKEFSVKLIESEEKERNRIALELHDSIGQKLLVIKNTVLALKQKVENENSIEPLNTLEQCTAESLSEIRSITSKLHPPILAKAGLTSAIETLIENVAATSNIDFSFFIDDIDTIFPKEHEINFYRIVQESINNIIKHSKASEAFVKILHENDFVSLEVKDNGCGIDNTSYKNGIGLVGMKERAVILGSEIKIFSDQSGTIIKMGYKIKKV